MTITCCFTVTPNLRLVLMTGVQFNKYFAKVEEWDKEGFNETLTVEVRDCDKDAILEQAKEEADRARAPPQVYRTETVIPEQVKGKGRRKRQPKPVTTEVFGELMFNLLGGYYFV